jgi:hypothetical protein
MEVGGRPARRTDVDLVLLALAFLVVSSCGGGAAKGNPDITGFITNVSGRADGVTVLVESEPSHPSIGDKASVAVTSSARITRKAQGGEVAATARDLVPGLQVQVWFDGPVATSYPVQGKAQALVIVR